MATTSQIHDLLQAVPVNRTLGLEVLQAVDGSALAAVTVPEALTNMIGSLHPSGLIGLIDAAGLAAIFSTCPDATPASDVVPLGAAAVVDFLAPAHGRLIGSCTLSTATRTTLQEFWLGHVTRVKLESFAAVSDATGNEVCRGSFRWSLSRTRPRPAAHLPELHLV